MPIDSLKAAATMKRKYYPLMTFVGAACFTAVPLMILSVAFTRQETVAPAIEPRTVLANNRTVDSLPSNPVAGQKEQQEKSRGNEPSTATGSIDKPAASAVRAPESDVIDQVLSAKANDESVETSAITSSVAESIADPGAIALESVGIDSAAVDGAAIANNSGPELEVVVETEPEVPSSLVAADTLYRATGHLAMANQPHVSDSGYSESGPSVNSPGRTVAGSASGSNAEPKSRKGKKTGRSRASESKENDEAASGKEAMLEDGAPMPVPRVADQNVHEAEVVIEDVAIQSPLENRVVSRVEDVVAMTGAIGWPVALIKSDLPDDVWWVQHMVGIQGNSFSARVNFGNEYSIPGTQYHLVFVFLDSADEVRRFRIAKQFKEIPKGVRRSREFLYIRN